LGERKKVRRKLGYFGQQWYIIEKACYKAGKASEKIGLERKDPLVS
jgi:hypothetical protein